MKEKIIFEGNLIDLDGNIYGSDPLKNLVLLIINNFPIYPEKFYKENLIKVNNDFRNIQWRLSSTPYFNAFMRPATNEIGINLFIILSILAIPNILKYINDSHRKATISIDTINTTLENLPDLLLTDIDKLFNSWAKVQKQSIEHGTWSLAHFPLIKNFYFFEPIGRFLIWHETAHWHLTKFNDYTKNLFFNQTQFHIINYIKEVYFNKNAPEMIIRHLNDAEIRENWIEEITCDVMSVFSHIKKFSNDYQRRDFYSSLAITFSILQYYTYFIERFYKEELSYHSHPPVLFRRDALYYIISKELNMTINDFIQYEFGAGYLTDNILSRILKKYSETH